MYPSLFLHRVHVLISNKISMIQNTTTPSGHLAQGQTFDKGTSLWTRWLHCTLLLGVALSLAGGGALAYYAPHKAPAPLATPRDNTVRGLATLEQQYLPATPYQAPLNSIQVMQPSTEAVWHNAAFSGLFQNNVLSTWGESEALLPTAHTFVKYSNNFQSRGVINFDEGRITIETIDGTMPIERLREAVITTLLTPLDPIHVDLFSTAPNGPGTSTPLLYGEVMGGNGQPMRWEGDTGAMADKLIQECRITRQVNVNGVNRLVNSVNIPLMPLNASMRASKYSVPVEAYAKKYNLATALIYAIMHTESNFNPYAVSASKALGLMQVVPETAGEEVHTYLTGKRDTPTVQTLLSPEDNIKYGTTYIHLLARNYFGKVADPTARKICIIAAYNGGPNAVLRTFAPNATEAIDTINSLTTDEVYETLTTKMPNLETRRYVDVVLGHMHNYAQRAEASVQ